MKVNHVYCGDSTEVLRRFPDNSVDSVVTDPPYELGFMGKSWDRTGIASSVELWAEVLRVLKPGGHLLSFGGTRTYHRMASAIEDAGFEIRDQLQWLYGTGFPKSMDISKAIDKMAGAEREVTGQVKTRDLSRHGGEIKGDMLVGVSRGSAVIDVKDKPATPEAQQWDGWGTALKPANEPIALARKPLSERTIAANVLKWGAGGINVDAARIGANAGWSYPKGRGGKGWGGRDSLSRNIEYPIASQKGRFPANVIFDEVAAAVLDEQSGVTRSTDAPRRNTAPNKSVAKGRDLPHTSFGFNDSGGASRFFYVAKASRRERTHNGQVDNKHPTVKPLKLMEYLIKLITPPGGIVLDPFCGSGTTLVAAKGLGFDYIGIDMSEGYVKLTKQRLDATPNKAKQTAMF